MSRIGKKPVTVPAGVTVTIDGATVTVKGGKGELTRTFSDLVTIAQEGSEVLVTRNDESTESNAQQGLTRTLIHNMVIGVSEGFAKKLELTGVGYRAALKGTGLARASPSRFPTTPTSLSRASRRSRSARLPPRSAPSVRPSLTRARASTTKASTFVGSSARLVSSLR